MKTGRGDSNIFNSSIQEPVHQNFNTKKKKKKIYDLNLLKITPGILNGPLWDSKLYIDRNYINHLIHREACWNSYKLSTDMSDNFVIATVIMSCCY